MRYWNVGRCHSYTLDWNIPRSLSTCDFRNVFFCSTSLDERHIFLVEEGANNNWSILASKLCKLMQVTSLFTVSNDFACSEVCVNLAYTMQRYMGLKVQPTWQNTAFLFDHWLIRRPAMNTSYVLGQRSRCSSHSSPCFETLLFFLMGCLLSVNVSIRSMCVVKNQCQQPFGGWIIGCWHLWPVVAFVVADLCGREGLWLWRRRRPARVMGKRLPGVGKQDIRSWKCLKV